MDVSQLHVDQALTGLSIGYAEQTYYAEEVYPAYPVDHESDRYFVHDMEQFRLVDDHRRPGMKSDEITWKLSTDSFYCDGHGRAFPIPLEYQKNADVATQLEIAAVKKLTEQMWIAREANLVSNLVTALSPTAVTAARWDNDANDPIPILTQARKTVKLACGYRANRLLISEAVWLGIMNNASVVGRVTGAQQLADSLITPEQFGKLVFGTQNTDAKVIIADNTYLTSAQGAATNTMDYIWGKKCLLYYKPASMGLQTMALGAHFRWNVLKGSAEDTGNEAAAGQLVTSWWSQERKATVIETLLYYDQKSISAGAGVMWDDCVGS